MCRNIEDIAHGDLTPSASSSATHAMREFARIHPVMLGRVRRFWPELDRPLRLRLVETQAFASGAELRSHVSA
jgi:hypothetical protein